METLLTTQFIYLPALTETSFTNPYWYIRDVFDNFSTLCSFIQSRDNDITREKWLYVFKLFVISRYFNKIKARIRQRALIQ